MHERDFAAAIARTRLKERASAMAHAVLVEGVGPAEAARRQSLTRQAAEQATRRVMREYRTMGGYPPHWEVITVCVPADLGYEIKDLARAAHEEWIKTGD